jgi:hypothetical protein
VHGGYAMIAIKTTDIAKNIADSVSRIYKKNEDLVIISKKEYNQFIKNSGKDKMTIGASIIADMKVLQQNVIDSGYPEMSIDEINVAIKESRQEKRGL